MMEERVNVRRELEKPKLRSITFIKQCLRWLKSVWMFPSSGKSNYMFCFAQNKLSSQRSTRHFSSAEKWLADSSDQSLSPG